MSKYGSEKSRPPEVDNTTISKSFGAAFPLLPSPSSLPPPPSPGEYSLDQDFRSHPSPIENKYSTPPRHGQTPEILRICNGTGRDLEGPEEKQEVSWNCSKCTYLNPESYLTCQMCNSIRESDDDGLIEEKEVCPVARDPPDSDTELPIPKNQLHNPYFYSLVSVVRHVGKSAFSGHYTCDVAHHESKINSEGRHWYHCDDSRVSQISQVFRPSSPPAPLIE